MTQMKRQRDSIRRVSSSFVHSLAKLGALILFREDSESLASMGRVEGFLCDNWVVSEIRSMPSVTCCPCDREQQENGHIGQDISKASGGLRRPMTSQSPNVLPKNCCVSIAAISAMSRSDTLSKEVCGAVKQLQGSFHCGERTTSSEQSEPLASEIDKLVRSLR